MAHGACTVCGCALEECIRDQMCPREIGRFVRPKPPPSPARMFLGDWVRVRRGHRLEGAAGCVKHIDRSSHPQLVRIRQLNGNELRLPLALLEFVSFSGSEPDVL